MTLSERRKYELNYVLYIGSSSFYLSSRSVLGATLVMLTVNENAFRDHLFEHHKEDIASLIVGRREPIQWEGEAFPPIHFLLQRRAEKKINEILEQLESLVLIAKELRLERSALHPTRVDLFGNSENTGITIIELKKSEQTERQSFTELLAYSNHFCSIFPGLTESAITLVLVAPMDTRTVKDAYVQELVSNQKNIVALIPHEVDGKFTLEVFYPDESYYRWFENNIINDHSMTCVSISFPLLKGWIDSDFGLETRTPPQYTIDALNTVSNAIALELEAAGFHAIVYATQKWGEIAQLFPYPNTFVVSAMNPFSSARTAVHEGAVYGKSEGERIEQVQAVYDQITDAGKEWYWVEMMESDFQGRLIRTVRDQFELCFLNDSAQISYEIGLPDWYGLKTSFVDAVSTHNLNIYSTGLLRKIYLAYVEYVFDKGEDEIYYYDDIPKYSYQMLTPFLAVWKIFKSLGFDTLEEQEIAD